jgi:hypothetical protein
MKKHQNLPVPKNKKSSRNKYRSIKQDTDRLVGLRFTDNRSGRRRGMQIARALRDRRIGLEMRENKTEIETRRAAHVEIEREKQEKRAARLSNV